MNILHVCCVQPNPCNGMSNVIPEHVQAQARIDNVHLLNLTVEGFNISSDLMMLEPEYKSIGFNGLLKRFGTPDLVIFHGIYLPKIWKFYKKNIEGKYKYIVLPHGSMSKTAQKKSKIKKTFFNHLLVFPFTQKALAVQFLSEMEYKVADEHFYIRHIISGNGINPQASRVDTCNGGKVKFVFIGRLNIFHKGLDLLIEACNIIRNNSLLKSNIEVHLFGPDDQGGKEYLINKVHQLKLEDYIHINEPIVTEEKQEVFLHNTTYFIMPSRSEGQPMGAMEALSYGIPIVVTPGTGFAEETELYQCGFTMKPDPQSIASVMLTAAGAAQNQERYKKMSDNAIRCISRYYWNNLARDTLSKYREIIEE